MKIPTRVPPAGLLAPASLLLALAVAPVALSLGLVALGAVAAVTWMAFVHAVLDGREHGRRATAPVRAHVRCARAVDRRR